MAISEKVKNFIRKQKVKFKYGASNLRGFKEGLAIVCIKGKYGFVDEKGDLVIKPIYDKVNCFENGKAKVYLDGKVGQIDKSGNLVEKFDYEGKSAYYEGLARVWVGDKVGYVDEDNNMVIKPQFRCAGHFSEGYAVVESDDCNLYGYIDRTGKVVIPYKFWDAEAFHEGLAKVLLPGGFLGYYGFIDKSGEIVIKPEFKSANNFCEGMAIVQSLYNRLYGVIDKSGKYIAEPKYDSIYPFYNEVAIVELNKMRGLIDKTGAEIIKPKYNHIYGYYNGVAECKAYGKIIFVDIEGKEYDVSSLGEVYLTNPKVLNFIPPEEFTDEFVKKEIAILNEIATRKIESLDVKAVTSKEIKKLEKNYFTAVAFLTEKNRKYYHTSEEEAEAFAEDKKSALSRLNDYKVENHNLLYEIEIEKKSKGKLY